MSLFSNSLSFFFFQNNNRGGYNVGDKTDKPATTVANQFNMVHTCSTVLPIICNNNLLFYSSFKNLVFVSMQLLHVPSLTLKRNVFVAMNFLQECNSLPFSMLLVSCTSNIKMNN